MMYPTIMVSIVYFAIKLNTVYAYKFFIAAGTVILTSLYGSAYGLFISVVIPKMEVAMAMVPILLVPLMICGGFFVN